MRIFYFALMTYNQEDLVEETLESFKYQIQNYGEDCSFNLIVVDDASIDNTVQVIKKWINYNSNLFNNVIWQLNNVNCGVVKNYQFIIDKIPDKCHFKLLAGDDVLSSNNIFSSYKSLDSNTIKTHVKLMLKSGIVYYNQIQLMDFYDHYITNRSHKYNLKWMRRGCYLHTPSTIYEKITYNLARCSEMNRHFRLFEDDPSWYSMIKNIPELKIDFLSTPIVLYRISDRAISNGNGITNLEFTEELKKLTKIYYHEEKGLWRLYYWFRIHQDLPKIMKINLYVDKLRKIYLFVKYANNKKFKAFKRKIDDAVIKEQKYYNVFIKKKGE